MDQRFRIGDRVRTTMQLEYVDANRQGIVVGTYPWLGFCEVQFDGERIIRVVAADSLAPQREDEGARACERGA